MEYPKRPQLYALKYLQWLAETAVANECGAESLAIITMVAITEDKLRYSRKVSFYNDQLCRMCGFSEPTLISARKRAVAAGLLHYQPGAKRRPALYFTLGMDIEPTEIDLKNLSESHENRSLPFSESHENRSPTIPILSCPKPNLKKRSAFDPLGIEFPDALKTDAFKAAWAEWVDHRREKKSPLTKSTTGKQIKKLAAWGSRKAIAAIGNSIEAGWIGLFEPKGCAVTDSTAGVQNDPSQWDDRFYPGDDAPPKGALL